MVPLTVRVLTTAAHLNSVGAERSAAAVPVNPQTDTGVVKIKLQSLLFLDRNPRESVHPIGAAAFRPEIESEIAGAEVPIAAVGNLHVVINAIEAKCLPDFARGKCGIVDCPIMAIDGVGRVAFCFPPGNHVAWCRGARSTFAGAAGVVDVRNLCLRKNGVEELHFVDQSVKSIVCGVPVNSKLGAERGRIRRAATVIRSKMTRAN